MSEKKLPLLAYADNQEYRRKLQLKVHDWFHWMRGKEMFDNAPETAKLAVEEYLANKDGLTIFPGKADYPKDLDKRQVS